MRSLRELIVHFMMFNYASLGTRLALICNALELHETGDVQEVTRLIHDCGLPINDLVACLEFLEDRLQEGKSFDVPISLSEIAKSAEDLPFRFDRDVDLN